MSSRLARDLAVSVGSALLALVVVGGVLTLAGFRLTREPPTPVAASAVAERVASAPVGTPTRVAMMPTTFASAIVAVSPTATATPMPVPTATAVGTVIVSTALANNRYVVTNTGGVGVVLREAPNPTAPVIVLIMEGEEVFVTAPPIDASGFVWFPVQRQGRAGFIRSEYLATRT